VTETRKPQNLEGDARLSEIAHSVNTLADRIEYLIGNISSDEYLVKSTPNSRSARTSESAYLKAASEVYSRRRSRHAIFGSESLFGEPAWDILLDLFTSELRGLKLSITDACIGSGVPSTTALRWISILEQEGLAKRSVDPRDARRSYIQLSAEGRERMEHYFDKVIAARKS
jgi:hypothetical protein